MILVTVGTHNQGFDRLVKAMDELAAELDEQVIIQYGSSSYVPRHAECFQWATSKEMQELTCKARVVVSHAAAGAILTALLEKKPLVVIPRSQKYGEHVDDHQFQLAQAVTTSEKAIAVLEPSPAAFLAAIKAADNITLSFTGSEQLVGALCGQLSKWEKTASLLERESQ